MLLPHELRSTTRITFRRHEMWSDSRRDIKHATKIALETTQDRKFFRRHDEGGLEMSPTKYDSTTRTKDTDFVPDLTPQASNVTNLACNDVHKKKKIFLKITRFWLHSHVTREQSCNTNAN